MTSKSPARRADDIDNATLSYAEIKALATGNPLIMEKCQLEVDVQKLQILRRSHKSEQWRIDDAVRSLPIEITRVQNLAAQVAEDVKRVVPQPEGTFSMTVEGKDFSNKEQAGLAVLAYIKNATTPKPVEVGDQRDAGPQLVRTNLGAASRCRLENLINRIPERQQSFEAQAAALEQQLETAKSQQGKPFEHEGELETMQQRLSEIDAELKLNEHTVEVDLTDGDTPDGDSEPGEREVQRTSESEHNADSQQNDPLF